MGDHPSQGDKLFDAHLHIIDPRFPLVPNQGFLPTAFTCEDYRHRMRNYALCGGAVVSGSFQAFDQTYLLDALERLGPTFVGVTQLPATATDAQILALHAAGVRGLRFNLRRGGTADPRHIEYMARRVHELAGWHVELYADAAELRGLYDRLAALPAVSIDHLGLSKAGLPTLLKLCERGVRVKATGFGRVDLNVRDALADLYAANPQALMFGTDLPSTRTPRSYRDDDFTLVIDTLGPESAANVLYRNAMEFYPLR